MRPIATSMVIRAPVLPIPALREEKHHSYQLTCLSCYTCYNIYQKNHLHRFPTLQQELNLSFIPQVVQATSPQGLACLCLYMLNYLQWTTTGPGPSARSRMNRTNSTNSTQDWKKHFKGLKYKANYTCSSQLQYLNCV